MAIVTRYGKDDEVAQKTLEIDKFLCLATISMKWTARVAKVMKVAARKTEHVCPSAGRKGHVSISCTAPNQNEIPVNVNDENK